MPRIFTLITKRSSFRLEILSKPGMCAGCDKKHYVGEEVYVQHWMQFGKRTVRTILCNLEECWEEYDARIFPGTEVEV